MKHPQGADHAASQSVTGAVERKVAELEGEEPLELPPPLHSVADPDALEALFADASTMDGNGGVRLEFSPWGPDSVLKNGVVDVNSGK